MAHIENWEVFCFFSQYGRKWKNGFCNCHDMWTNILKVVVSNIFGIFTPKIGEDEPNLTSIFFNWVGSTIN